MAITYAFIDCAYARKRLNSAMHEVFGVDGDLAPERIAPTDAVRAFVYDCVDDEPRQNETPEEFKARTAAQENSFARMRSRPGMHLRLGTLKGKKRRSQKEVDILLAVDMLTHGFNRNMTDAILLAGDLDFRPVVEALARGGVFVQVWYVKSSAAKELPLAADFGCGLDWYGVYSWNSQEFRNKYRPPVYTSPTNPHTEPRGVIIGRWAFDGNNAELYRIKGPTSEQFVLRVEKSDGIHFYDHADRRVLVHYFEAVHGKVDWEAEALAG